MRTLLIGLSCWIGLGLVSCTREDKSQGNDPAARQAGREAYRASQDLKRDAKQAAQELRKASKEFREGWSEEKKRHDSTHQTK